MFSGSECYFFIFLRGFTHIKHSLAFLGHIKIGKYKSLCCPFWKNSTFYTSILKIASIREHDKC